MTPIKIEPSNEILQLLRKSREIEDEFLIENGLYHKYDNVNDFISDEIKNIIEVLISLGFSEQQIEYYFKSITL